MQGENGAGLCSHSTRPAPGRIGLAAAGVEPGITRVHRKACQEEQATPEGEEAGMVWPQYAKQVFQVVDSRDRQAEFDQKRFQELFRGLLTMETDSIIFRWPASIQFSGDAVIALGLADSIGR